MRTSGFADDDLMKAIASGGEVAFAELVARHRDWVRNLLYGFTRDRDQAEDLTQEAFIRMLKGAREYEAQGQFRAWLKQIAVNLGKNHLAQARRIATESLSEYEETDMATGRSDPMALLMDALVQTQIREAIQSLPEDHKNVILMRYFSGMTVLEIAETMQCPEGTVKSRIFHGLRRIRERLSKAEE